MLGAQGETSLPASAAAAITSGSMDAESVTLDLDEAQSVTGRLLRPPGAVACYVMAPGAGAGMEHPFMAACAAELAGLGIATLRYEFPYMQRGSRRPDPPQTCHATVRAAVRCANGLRPALPLIAGGKSFGGRMTSQAQALDPLPGVLGLAFLGFPLHPAKKPSDARARHLYEVNVSMLFLQGTRDELASLVLLQALVRGLGRRAMLHLAEGADHSFHVPTRSGRNDAEVRRELLHVLSEWSAALIEGVRTT
jgi:predicted alpha/beta-hydrolase family hydrolase